MLRYINIILRYIITFILFQLFVKPVYLLQMHCKLAAQCAEEKEEENYAIF